MRSPSRLPDLSPLPTDPPPQYQTHFASLQARFTRQRSVSGEMTLAGRDGGVAGHTQSRVPSLGSLTIWRFSPELSALDPAYLQAFREKWYSRRLPTMAQQETTADQTTAGDGVVATVSSTQRSSADTPWATPPICLAIAYCGESPWEGSQEKDDEGIPLELPDESPLAHFAWKLERHWLVEWSEDDSPFTNAYSGESGGGERARHALPRPPVALIHSMGVSVLGAALPPRMRPVLGALVTFLLITADELRAAFHLAGEPVPSAPELSRALSYLESSGFLTVASAEDTERYRAERKSLGRRPLRVYTSAAHCFNALADRATLNTNGRRPRLETASDWGSAKLDADGKPSLHARLLFTHWERDRLMLGLRGLRTV
jgi:hypothetical protein